MKKYIVALSLLLITTTILGISGFLYGKSNNINTKTPKTVLTLPIIDIKDASIDTPIKKEPVLERVPIDANGKIAYLTFDDGPSNECTPKVLDILKQNNILATFFLIHNPNCEDVYKKIKLDGHAIGNHTYSHNYSYIYSNQENFFTDLKKMDNFLQKIIETSTKLVRFPGGSSNKIKLNHGEKPLMPMLSTKLTELGYSYFDWNIDSGDANDKTSSKDSIVSQVKSQVKDQRQIIVLMHDFRFRQTTVQALPEIIQFLKEKGYQFDILSNNSFTYHF